MPLHRLSDVASFILAAALCAMAPAVLAQVYKCTNGAGRTTYSDVPCDPAGKPLALPGAAKGSATKPSVCAQLLDETNRLAAEAERDNRRGRAESTGNAKRRQQLTQQYQTRCASITSSAK